MVLLTPPNTVRHPVLCEFSNPAKTSVVCLLYAQYCVCVGKRGIKLRPLFLRRTLCVRYVPTYYRNIFIKIFLSTACERQRDIVSRGYFMSAK